MKILSLLSLKTQRSQQLAQLHNAKNYEVSEINSNTTVGYRRMFTLILIEESEFKVFCYVYILLCLFPKSVPVTVIK